MQTLVTILVFAPLSLVSFGGGQAIVADMQHQTVDVQHWMSGTEFARFANDLLRASTGIDAMAERAAEKSRTASKRAGS